MTVAIIGGLDRLRQHYVKLAEEEDLDIKVFNRYSPGLRNKIAQTDGVILFTNLISHKAAQQVRKLARDNKINLICSHKCSVSTARDCIVKLKNNNQCSRLHGIKSSSGCGSCPCNGCQGNCGCKEGSNWNN